MNETYLAKIIEESNEILKNLELGINIPILQEFQPYILNDIKYFRAKSIMLMKGTEQVGNVLMFDGGNKALYFGFFGVVNHNAEKISFLIDKLITYAKENEYSSIRGPINIPVIIYGWGFMKEGSKDDLFIGKPVNPPIYQEMFIKKGFYLAHETNTWEGPMPKIDPWKLEGYDFTDFEYFFPKDFNEVVKYSPDFLRLQAENLPSSAHITPNVAGVAESYVDFAFKFGYQFMLFFVRHKPTDKIVACGGLIPNPLRKDSAVFYTWVVAPEYRRKGLVMLMYGATSLLLWEKGVRYLSGPISTDNLANNAVAENIGAKIERVHQIFEYNVK